MRSDRVLSRHRPRSPMTAIGTDSPAGPAIVLGRVRPAGKVERILRDEGIQFLFQAQTLNVQGRSGDSVSLTVRHPPASKRSRAATSSWRRARSQHRRQRARRDRRRIGCARLYPRQRAAGSLLHVYRAAARSRRTERTRSTTAKRDRPRHPAADERRPTDGDDRRDTGLHEGPCRRK